LGTRKPQLQSWMSYAVGRAGFHLNAVMSVQKLRIRAELFITGDRAKTFFGLLKIRKAEIERELGYPWNGRSCRRRRPVG